MRHRAPGRVLISSFQRYDCIRESAISIRYRRNIQFHVAVPIADAKVINDWVISFPRCHHLKSFGGGLS